MSVNIASLKGKKITVMGLGLHGGALGNIRWLASQGARLTVTDLKSADELRTTVEKLKNIPQLTLVLGEHREQDFTTADLVVRNPAVPRNSSYLQLAREAGVPIEMDSSLFFQFSPSHNIIGVTGSKGKTTTASAIATFLKAAMPQTVAVGIDGVSPLAELDSIQPDSPVVFELSSWRLEALGEKKISPTTAVVTSIYRDHLNTYDSFEHYIATKQIIVAYQRPVDRALLNRDDAELRRWESQIHGQLYWYTLQDLPHGFGIFVRNGVIMIRDQDQEIELFPLEKLPLPAEHERRNLLPGILLAYLSQVSPQEILGTLSRLQRLPHRLEIVRELRGVTYINDSAATMPDATIAALRAYQSDPLIHIVGGSDKALLFDELAQMEAQATIRGIIFLPGTATATIKEKMDSALKGRDIPMYDAASMSQAVEQAQKMAQSGERVLLSPGATSFGLFKHEFDRGNQFRQAVLSLS